MWTTRIRLRSFSEVATSPSSRSLENAAAHDVAGLIVFNHEAGGEELINMAGTDGVDFPSVFLGHSAGSHLRELISRTYDGKYPVLK